MIPEDAQTQLRGCGLVAVRPAVHPRLIVGDGEQRNNLKSLANELGISSNVVFAGFRSDIPDVLRAMGVYVLSSIFEGTSLGLLEAHLQVAL